MAYVRKVRTASGAVAVQVARKDAGKVVILAHLGSAHTDAELGVLLEQAKAMVIGGQVALDFEVSARAQSMADVADFRAQALIPDPSRPAGVGPVVPPGRTVGTSSRLLYDLLGHVYDWLGFDAVGDAVFRDLVIARIVEPTSKLDASRVLADLGAQLVSYKTIDR
ncbi:IS1634 family transposase, partial [Mycobacterium sp. NPDC003449]